MKFKLFILFVFINLYANEPKFLLSYEYIQLSDYNQSVKHEMKQMISITQSMFTKDSSHLIEKALMGAQYSDCVESHLSKNDFTKFISTIEEEVYKQNDLKIYKKNLIKGQSGLFNFLNSNISSDLSLEEVEQYYNKVFACEKLKK